MKEVALYVHIPFCKQKCLYCDFASFANIDALMEEYINALIKEIIKETKGYKIKSLFIGGGTPSYLNETELEKLIKAISSLNYIDNAEKTIECNPGTVNEKKLKIIKNGEINRLSFGLQTTNNNLLKEIGRIHSYEEFLDNYNLARKLGFDNINVDIMFGLPNQKVDDFINSLKEVIDLGVNHISCYSLIVEEGTPFYNMNEKGLLKLPSEDEEREMYVLGKKILLENKYVQYEISNFAKDGKQCYHNKIYWKCEEYIGVGLGASSFINNKRIKKISNIREYIKRVNNNQCIKEEEYVNNINDNIEEFMFMNLRMNKGVDEKEFFIRFNKNVDDIYKQVIEKHIRNGLLVRENYRIYLTEKGIELSNYVMSDMILNH